MDIQAQTNGRLCIYFYTEIPINSLNMTVELALFVLGFRRSPKISEIQSNTSSFRFSIPKLFSWKFEENFDNIWKLMESDYKFFQIDKNVLKRHSLKIPNAQNFEHSKSRTFKIPIYSKSRLWEPFKEFSGFLKSSKSDQ
jgi:hypothetical protein